jgi:protein BUR2
MPSQSYRTPGYSQSSQEKFRDPIDVLAEAEQQWIFTEDELLRAPSIVDGMGVAEERELRGKGNNFITQVGIMLKLPQITLSTAAIFFNRFLMRRSLVTRKDYKALHQYVCQLAE